MEATTQEELNDNLEKIKENIEAAEKLFSEYEEKLQ
jgi:hypothetical protein